MKRGRFDNGTSVSLKIDMAKSYDQVEWLFLKTMMLRLGLAPVFVEIIMRCVTSVSFSFNVNREIQG